MYKQNLLKVLGISAILTGTLLSGCSSSTKSSSDSSKNNVTTIRFSTWDEGHEDVIKAFEAQNPNIKIKYERVPDQYTTKLLTQMAAGEAPDVIQVENTAQLASKGVLEDLSNFTKKDSDFKKEDYYPKLYDIGTYKGKLYALTKDFSDMAIFYNKKLFDEAKLPYPKDGWTWEQYKETAEKLTKKNNGKVTQWGATIQTASFPYETILQSNGGQISNEDATKTEGYLNGDRSIQLAKFLSSFFSEGISPSQADRDSLKGVDLFASGKVAMTMTGTWFIPNWNQTPGFKYGAVGLPAGSEKRANFIYWSGFGINKDSKHKEAAWKFLKFIGGYEGQKVYSKAGIPSMPKVAEDLGMSKDPIKSVLLNGLNNLVELSYQRNGLWSVPANNVLNPLLEEKIPNLAAKGKLDDKQIKELLDAGAKDMDKALKDEMDSAK